MSPTLNSRKLLLARDSTVFQMELERSLCLAQQNTWHVESRDTSQVPLALVVQALAVGRWECWVRRVSGCCRLTGSQRRNHHTQNCSLILTRYLFSPICSTWNLLAHLHWATCLVTYWLWTTKKEKCEDSLLKKTHKKQKKNKTQIFFLTFKLRSYSIYILKAFQVFIQTFIFSKLKHIVLRTWDTWDSKKEMG